MWMVKKEEEEEKRNLLVDEYIIHIIHLVKVKKKTKVGRGA